jgi:hypothetical protein
MTTIKPRPPETFASVVTRIADVVKVEYIAAHVEVSASSVYAWMDPDRKHLPTVSQAAVLDRLYYQVKGDTPLAAMMMTRAMVAPPPAVGPLHDEIMDLPAALGRVVDAVKSALHPEGPGGATITRYELDDIEKSCRSLMDEIKHVREAAKQGCVTLVCEGKI